MSQIGIDFSDPIHPTTPPPEYIRAVWNVLRARRGRALAIGKSEIARHLGIHERRVTHAVKVLVEVMHYRIGSTPSHPPGYFVIETQNEADECCERYHGQALSLLHRERILRDVVAARLTDRLKIELENR